jgi:ABC-type nitrate/sulfonate/bicarbonate transport system permease component
LRPLPPVALIPFFILWFGIGSGSQVGLVALGAFMVLTVSTLAAVAGIPPPYIRAAGLLGAARVRLYRTVIVPAITPALLAACRVAAALAFGTALAAEFIGAQSGIGFMMMVARRTLNTDTIAVGIIVIALESYGFDWLLRTTFEYLTRWSDRPLDVLRNLHEE